MNDVVIRVENLSKKYVIQHNGGSSGGDGLRHAIDDIATAPVRWLRKAGILWGAAGRSRFPTSLTPASRNISAVNNSLRSTTEEFYALRDVSFEVKRGEVVGIIGRNGAGKSTLLKILSRITEPSSGRIGINGRVASLLEVGTGFHPELTGRENIFLNGAILGMTRAEINRKFNEIVEFAGVEKFLDSPVKHYSSGMYVRLAFAVAAHLEPEILIVDEVLAVGDADFQKKCLGKMKDVSMTGRTVIFVSHDMRAVEALCPRSILLKKGQVELFAESSNSIAKYLELQPDSGNPFARVASTSIARLTGFNAEGDTFASVPRAGHPCRFTVEIVAFQSISFLRVAIGIDDKFGRRLLTLDTNNYNISYQVEAGEHQFACCLPCLPLKPDRYRVHLYVGDSYGAYDYIGGEVPLSIESPSVYPNPKHDETHGPLLQPHEWIKCG